jgi:WD40 repeat protein
MLLLDNMLKRPEAKVWDAVAWETPDAFTAGNEFAPWDLSPDGRTLAVSEADPGAHFSTRALGLYDTATGRRRAGLDGQRHVAFAPNGRTVATAPEKAPVVSLWDAETGERRASREVPVGPLGQLEFTADGRSLLACFATRSSLTPRLPPRDQVGATAVLLDADGLAERARCAGAWGPAHLSEDGAALAAYGPGPTVRVFDAEGKLRVSVPREDRIGLWPEPFALSPDGRTLVVVGGPDHDFAEQRVRLFEAATGEERAVLRGDARGLLCLAFSPDGRTLATGHAGGWYGVGWVKLWDAGTGEERATLWSHRAGVEWLFFTPDGRRLIGGGGKGVKFWDPVIGQEVLALPGGSGGRLSRDGRLLAVGPSRENGGQVRLWRVPAATSP